MRAAALDPVVSRHYLPVRLASLRTVFLDRDRAVHVSYRKAGRIYWTKRKIVLKKGEKVLSDGNNQIRARCGNRISEAPMTPVAAEEPTEEVMNAPVLEVPFESLPGFAEVPGPVPPAVFPSEPAEVAEIPAGVPEAGGGGVLPWLPVIAAPVVGVLPRGGSEVPPAQPPGPPGPPTPPPPGPPAMPVPEPGTYLLIAGGLAIVAGMEKLRSRPSG